MRYLMCDEHHSRNGGENQFALTLIFNGVHMLFLEYSARECSPSRVQ